MFMCKTKSIILSHRTIEIELFIHIFIQTIRSSSSLLGLSLRVLTRERYTMCHFCFTTLRSVLHGYKNNSDNDKMEILRQAVSTVVRHSKQQFFLYKPFCQRYWHQE